MAFNIESEIINNAAKLTLIGELDGGTAPLFKEKIEEIAQAEISKLVLMMDQLEYMSSAGLRILVFAKQKMGNGVEIFLVGTQEMVNDTIEQTGLHHSFHLVESYDFDS
ncbi:anti-sigma factor antagonist [Synechocystis salina LEGE 06155]|nr:anti-sigma factor antagonist [Synechocystis salina LEGE 06155]